MPPAFSLTAFFTLASGFFGWGYEDHELLWRVEGGGGEADRGHWGGDVFVWFEGYDEVVHSEMAGEAKVQQHKQNRAR